MTFTTVRDRAILWDDQKRSIIHLCEGADVHPGVRLVWTKCRIDVPANAAHLQGTDRPNCPRCLEQPS